MYQGKDVIGDWRQSEAEGFLHGRVFGLAAKRLKAIAQDFSPGGDRAFKNAHLVKTKLVISLSGDLVGTFFGGASEPNDADQNREYPNGAPGEGGPTERQARFSPLGESADIIGPGPVLLAAKALPIGNNERRKLRQRLIFAISRSGRGWTARHFIGHGFHSRRYS